MDAFQRSRSSEANTEAFAGLARNGRKNRVLARQPASRSRRLLAHEGAFLFQVSLRNVRNMIRTGELTDVGADRWRRLDPEEVAERVRDRPLALAALDAILDGRLRLERPGLDDSPVSLMERWENLW